MTRFVFITLCTLSVTTPSFADVTVKSTGSGKGLGMTANMTTVTYIKGNKMRTDTINGGTIRSTIFDVDNQRMYSFDSKKKEADSWDMQAFSAEMSKNVDVSGMKATVTANGKTKEIAGRTVTGYDMAIEVPATVGGSMKMTINLTGPMWVAKGAPGSDDYIAFYKGAVDKGWIFSDPRGAKASPGQAKAMAEMYRHLAETGGIPYETEMSIKMAGDGPMGAMMAKMGGMSAVTTVESVETGALAAELFAPPAGYRIKEQK